MTVDEIKQKITLWQAAEVAAMRGKSYTVDGVTVTRQDMGVIRDALSYWYKMLRAKLKNNADSVTTRPAFLIDRGGCRWQ